MTVERWERFREMAAMMEVPPERVLRLWIEQKIADTFARGLDKRV